MNTDRAIELSGADLDAMVAGYLECQLWAGLDYREEGAEPVPYDENYSVSDIAPEYVDKIRAELSDIVTAHPLAIRMFLNHRAYYHAGENGVIVRRRRINPSFDSGQFGHDFCLTREGHGTGFWDRGLGELGDYLTSIAKSYGEAEILWDNGDGVLR